MNCDDNLKWYHGKIAREAAENLLKDEGEDGAFLVRESNSSVGDYVLSVLYDGEVVHYQIRRHGEDAFFSIEEHTAVHGLDSLIQHYQGDANGLVTKLTVGCKGNPPPHNSRTHGRTNLLHRATEAGNFDVVSQMMDCGYQLRDAKNQDGQTAVHLASKSGRDEILAKLIHSGASVNCRDSAGYTPLHYACQQNFSNTIKLLVVDGGANIQTRHAQTGKVPLHEAAQSGHLECIKTLLDLNAPANPRTIDNKTPADLAQENNHVECVNFLKCFTPPIPKSSRIQWYHGTLSREEAINILKDYSKAHSQSANGLFLIRYSNRNKGAYVLTLLCDGMPYNFIIRKEEKKLFIDDGPYLDSLEHLVDHYSVMSDGLPMCLLIPVPPCPKPPLPEFSTMPRIKKNNPHRNKQLSVSVKQNTFFNRKGSLPVEQVEPPPIPPLPNDIKSIDFLTQNLSFSADFPISNNKIDTNSNHNEITTEQNFGNKVNNNSNVPMKKDKSVTRLNLGSTLSLPPNSTDGNIDDIVEEMYKVPKSKKLYLDTIISTEHNQNIDIGTQLSSVQDFIPQNELVFGSVLGEGEFGSVLKGFYNPPSVDPIEVAIKTLHTQHVETNKQEFLREARVMMELNHTCIVKLIGVSVCPQLAMVQELAPLGSLLKFLVENPEQASPMYELKLWACQVACGMQYLEEKRFVHRDLATRNILLSDKHQAKISDFGLSRALSTNSSYYKASQGGKWPIKWYAPESYNFGTFSNKSDVWSFGVTLWEMYSYGKQPYGDKRGVDVIEMLENGKRLERPEDCPEEIYLVMFDCWAYDPQERPSFNQLVNIFSSHPEYMNISQLVLSKKTP